MLSIFTNSESLLWSTVYPETSSREALLEKGFLLHISHCALDHSAAIDLCWCTCGSSVRSISKLVEHLQSWFLPLSTCKSLHHKELVCEISYLPGNKSQSPMSCLHPLILSLNCLTLPLVFQLVKVWSLNRWALLPNWFWCFLCSSQEQMTSHLHR